MQRRVLQALILDLPDFEVFLTNPRDRLVPGRPVRIYRALRDSLASVDDDERLMSVSK